MTTPEHTTVDMLLDAKGRLVPRRLVRDVDLARDGIVRELIEKAMAHSALLAKFKRDVLNDIQAFTELSAEQYGVQLGGDKGNITLLTYDGKYKVTRQIADLLVFDERLQVAKQLVDECINEWSAGASDEIQALVAHAFQVDKAGKVSTERVLGLRKLAIDAPRWTAAMRAIADSIAVVSTSTYVRFYERIEGTEQWRPISLDFASVTGEP